MLTYRVGCLLASCLAGIAAVLVTLRFWKTPGAWRLVVAYAMIGFGFDVAEWSCWRLHHSTFSLRMAHDVILQSLALLVLMRLNLHTGRRCLAAGIAVGSAALLLVMALLPVHDLTIWRSIDGAWVFTSVLTTLLFFYTWGGIRNYRIQQVAEFWLLASLLVYYAAQAAMANWLHLVVNGEGSLLWAAFAVSVLPEALAAAYLIKATRVRSYA